MSTVVRTVTLKSDRHFGKRLPPEAIGHALTAIPKVVRESISMAIRGRSGLRGPRPGWLRAASDIRFVDHRGDEDSTLVFEAPTLGEAARELYEQQEFWSTRPDPELTGFDLFGEVVREVVAGNQDSDRFDKRLLERLTSFDHVLNGTFQEIRIDPARPDGATTAAVINPQVIQTARDFQEATPLPQRVRVVGLLDMVRASTQSLALRLDDGQEVRGVLIAGSIVEAAALLNRRVLVLGRAVYRTSGRVLRVDVDQITEAAESEPSFWSRIPAARMKQFNLRHVLQQQQHKKGVAAIMGKWPGDETDEEIEQALKELS